MVNQPVVPAQSSTTPGVGGTTTSSVSYLPIGTSINVLPKRLEDGRISLQVLITYQVLLVLKLLTETPTLLRVLESLLLPWKWRVDTH